MPPVGGSARDDGGVPNGASGAAGGRARPGSPVVFRGHRAPLVCYPAAVVFVVVLVAIAIALPREHSLAWGIADRVGLVVFALVMAYGLHRVGSVRAVADPSGLTVRNVLRTRRLEWAEIIGLRFSIDDPWVLLDLSDSTTLAVMGIQASDGPRARRDAEALAALVARYTPH
ncbi:MAG: PH domain-containing protein [Actinomycetes bacterium]